jgi:hypothetical protein
LSCITILPIGPRSVPEFSLDTIESIFRYWSGGKLIILDDTVSGLGPHYEYLRNRADIIRCFNDGSYSTAGRLYKNVSRAIQHALDNYDFDIVLRIDDDALVIGAGYEDEAIRRFNKNPNVGLLGSYKITCMGSVRDFSPAAQMLEREMSPFGALVHPERWRTLRELVGLAENNGLPARRELPRSGVFF